MIKAGAFDSLGTNRATLLYSFEDVLDTISADQKRALSGQVNMFDFSNNGAKDESLYQIVPKEEMNKKELLSLEKDVLGLYISGHPLDALAVEIEEYSTLKSKDLIIEEGAISNIKDGQVIKFIGIITSVRMKVTKSNDVMAFVTFEDLYGEISTIAFPKTYAQYKSMFYEDNILKVEGRVNLKDDEVSIVALKVYSLDQTNKSFWQNFKTKSLTLNIPQNLSDEELTNLRGVVKELTNQKGNTKVTINNNGVEKVFDMFLNEKAYNKLKEIVSEDYLIWK